VADKPTKPSRFSPDWWTARNAVMAETSASQARLRKAYPLPEDRDPILRRLLGQRSEAALAVALYGDDPKSDALALRDAFDDAVQAVERYRAVP
jgi:hypothetical protein